MYIDTFPTAAATLPQMLSGNTALVIDVFRATSTMTTALANGASQILPAATVSEARQLAADLTPGSYLLGGERKAVLIPGFDLDNSPRAYGEDLVKAKTIVFTTSNGTKAIRRATTAQNLFLAAFLNARAAAKLAAETKRDVFLVCAGTNDKFSLDDAVCAGLLIEHLTSLKPRARLSDFSLALHQLYLAHRHKLAQLMAKASHHRRLLDLNLKDDITYCLQQDIFNLVPLWDGSKIISP
jgi:2-phosphosulfolactate phosphatase